MVHHFRPGDRPADGQWQRIVHSPDVLFLLPLGQHGVRQSVGCIVEFIRTPLTSPFVDVQSAVNLAGLNNGTGRRPADLVARKIVRFPITVFVIRHARPLLHYASSIDGQRMATPEPTPPRCDEWHISCDGRSRCVPTITAEQINGRQRNIDHRRS
ncbi:hypothetical protein ACFVYA_39145 [Amycolatopsis sp. NPDC058278]|uniref:hypothetical protein n=1 Tax=Amycolatopsis sp. NPDC058278 TaxID=3346417 RepID=UPI0036DDBC95